jgi:hypothetical protein
MAADPVHDPFESISSNPVARAHARARTRSYERQESRISGVLVWLVVVPGILLLVSNPFGWIVLFLLVMGFAALTGFGGIF